MLVKFLKVILIIVLLFTFTKVASAISFIKQFSGIILNTKATKIREAEAENYACIVPGTTIQINAYKGATNYYIPAWVPSDTDIRPASNQLIMGKYGPNTPITCIYKGYPPNIRTVYLPTIKFFGNSESY